MVALSGGGPICFRRSGDSFQKTRMSEQLARMSLTTLFLIAFSFNRSSWKSPTPAFSKWTGRLPISGDTIGLNYQNLGSPRAFGPPSPCPSQQKLVSWYTNSHPANWLGVQNPQMDLALSGIGYGEDSIFPPLSQLGHLVGPTIPLDFSLSPVAGLPWATSHMKKLAISPASRSSSIWSPKFRQGSPVVESPPNGEEKTSFWSF